MDFQLYTELVFGLALIKVREKYECDEIKCEIHGLSGNIDDCFTFRNDLRIAVDLIKNED